MKKERADRKPTIEKLKEIMVELTETAFTVKVGSDDSGTHMCAYVERDLDGNDVCYFWPAPAVRQTFRG